MLDALAGLPRGAAPGAAARRPRRSRPRDAARELGVTREAAEPDAAPRPRAAALAAPSSTTGTDDVPTALAVLDRLLDETALPRGPISAGRAASAAARAPGRRGRRRRVALASGAFAYEPDRQRRQRLAPGRARPRGAGSAADEKLPTAGDMLDGDQIRRLGPSRSRGASPAPTTTPPATASTPPCQQDRFADPTGLRRAGADLRGRRRRRSRAAVQTVEVSRSTAGRPAALPHHGRLVRRLPRGRLQVLERLPRRRHRRRGRRAHAAGLDASRSPPVRRGRPHRPVTTSTVGTTVGAAAPAAPDHPVAGGLGRDAVRAQRRRRAACATRPPAPYPRRPRATSAASSRWPTCRRSAASTRPWVGTAPTARARTRRATTCDRADFARGGARAGPDPDLPDPAGRRARPVRALRDLRRVPHPPGRGRFLAGVRRTVAGCEKRDLATEGRRQRAPHGGRRSSTCPAGTSAPRSPTRRRCASALGFVRVGNTVAQLTFAPDRSDDMTARGLRRAAGPRRRPAPRARLTCAVGSAV